MLEGWQIAVIVICVLVALYLLLVLVGLIFAMSFRILLKKHVEGLNLVTHTKYENIEKLLNIMKKYIDVDKKYFDVLNSIDISHLPLPDSQEGINVRQSLGYLKDELLFLSNKNPILQKHDEFAVAKEFILEQDRIYFIQINVYNADVIGFNYWIRFIPSRFIFSLLKVKQKPLIC